METWYFASLGDGMTADLVSMEIKMAFQRSFPDGGMPLGMAVFTRLESEGRLHCEMMAYFSPSAWEIAEMFGAELCDKPFRMGLDLLVGDEQAWQACFG